MVAIMLQATTLPSRDACCAVGGQYLPVAGSGTSAQSPSAQRPSTLSTFKFELTLTRPRSFSHGTRSRIGLGACSPDQCRANDLLAVAQFDFIRPHCCDFALRPNLDA